MKLEEIEQLKEEFKQELKNTPNLIKFSELGNNEILKAYSAFLEKKYGEKWGKKCIEISEKESELIKNVMSDLGYLITHTLNETKYVKPEKLLRT